VKKTLTQLATPVLATSWPATPQLLTAQEDLEMQTRLVAIPDTEVHALRSEIIDDDFELWIARPQAGYFTQRGSGPDGVLFVLDANLFFGTAVEMTRIMHRLFSELPPLLVVGIAYPTNDGMLQSLLRTRDFTPSVDSRMAGMSARLPQSPTGRTVAPPMGGAAAFLEFMADEVKPFVNARYGATDKRTTLFGSSMGGLLVVHAALSAPRSYDNFIAVSPALWWNQEEVFGSEQRRAQATGNVFIAVGGLEEDPAIPGLADFKMVTNAQRLAAEMAEPASSTLRIHFEEIAGETHTSVVPVALTRGLRWVQRQDAVPR
jgi:predicted alpha/beta superfamily hydrolase